MRILSRMFRTVRSFSDQPFMRPLNETNAVNKYIFIMDISLRFLLSFTNRLRE